MKFNNKRFLTLFVLVLGMLLNPLLGIEFYELDEFEKDFDGDESVMKKSMDILQETYKDFVSPIFFDEDYEENGEPEIDIEKSYPASIYQEESNLADNEVVEPRFNRAKTYYDNGNIDKFTEITRDIISRYPLNLYTAAAAMLNGDFEQLIFNLEEAQKYYIFVVNVHFNSRYGIPALIQLAYTLEKRNYHLASEQLLIKVLKMNESQDYHLEIAKHLHDKIVTRTFWFWNNKKYTAVNYYLNLYKDLENIKQFQLVKDKFSKEVNPKKFIHKKLDKKEVLKK